MRLGKQSNINEAPTFYTDVSIFITSFFRSVIFYLNDSNFEIANVVTEFDYTLTTLNRFFFTR